MLGIAGVFCEDGSAPLHCRTMLEYLAPPLSTDNSSHSPHLRLNSPDATLGWVDYRAGGEAVALDQNESGIAPGRHPFLVADARLDNRSDLCRKLDLSLAMSDRSLLRAAWLKWGADMVGHLLGGFALACWDATARTLFLARDHSGERPLHFARSPKSGGSFAFASTPLALGELPWVGREIDVARFANFLAIVTPGDSQTAFRGIERLLPGHWLKWTPQGIQVRCYWHPSNAPQIRYRRDAEYVDDLRARLDDAVAARLAGTTGIASELSGGLDSTSVTATAARLLEQQGRRLTAFTAIPLPGYSGRALPGRIGDEGPQAAEVTTLYPNIDHVLVDTAGRDLVDAAQRAARLTGEPAFNPTNQLWVDAILEGVRSRGLGVLLQGVSGNGTISFGGLIGLSDLFRRGRWFTLLRQTRELRAGGHTSWRGAAAWATGPVTPMWLRRLFDPEMRGFSFAFSPVHPDRAAEYHLKQRVQDGFFGAENSSAAVRRQMYEYFDPGVANAAAAAGWQIEQRDPTQDKRIYDFCYGIPMEQYLAGGQSRSLVRRAMQGRLPESTLKRTDRGLQAADWYLVVGAQRVRLLAELPRAERSPLVRHLIDTARLRTLLHTWPADGYHQPSVNEEWHLALTRGIAAASFLAEYDPQMPHEA